MIGLIITYHSMINPNPRLPILLSRQEDNGLDYIIKKIDGLCAQKITSEDLKKELQQLLHGKRNARFGFYQGSFNSSAKPCFYPQVQYDAAVAFERFVFVHALIY